MCSAIRNGRNGKWTEMKWGDEEKKIFVFFACRIRCWREAEQAGLTLCEAPLMLAGSHWCDLALAKLKAALE